MNTKSLVAVCLGTAAVAVIVAAEVQGWPIGPAASAMLGAIAGFVPGYLAPSPNPPRERVRRVIETVVVPVNPRPASETIDDGKTANIE